MRGRTLSPTVANWSHTPSYVQINIYNTSLEELRDRGVDLKHFLKEIGCRCIVMDVPILLPTKERCSVHLEDQSTATPGHNILPSGTLENSDDIPGKVVPSDLRSVEKPHRTERRCPSPRPNACGNAHSIGAERPNLDALHDRVNDTNLPADYRESVFARVAISELTSAVEAAGQPLFEAPAKPRDDNYIEDIPSGCGEIRDGLEGTGSGWPYATELDGSLVKKEAEENSGTTGRESPKTYTELEPPTRASLASDRDDVAEGGHSNWIFSVPREDYHLEAISDNFSQSDLYPDKTTRSSEKRNDSPCRSRNQQVLEDSQKSDCKREENKNFTSTRSDNKLKSLLKAGERSTNFKCRMLGCGRNLKWQPRMGRNHLVDHVRTHWQRNVKKCKLCDYKAVALRKVHHHHVSEHSDKPFMGAISCETEDDLKELQRLYVQCFPEVVAAQFSDGMLPQFGFRSSHTRQIKLSRKRKKHSQ
uniref:C2H2-type domain-containing protein n=1 Tax=Haemonchus contortus TaxID=6289 RepID=A0A7I4XYD9_HAECO